MSEINYNALAQAIDTSWGRSSTPKTASYSVKISMLGPDKMLLSYAAVVNFGTERAMIEMKRAYAGESESIISEVIKRIKSTYKEISSSTLKIKEDSSTDSLEIINMNVHNAKRTAYYRRRTIVEIA